MSSGPGAACCECTRRSFESSTAALLAEHGFGVDAYGVLITLVTAPERHAPDRRAGRAAQPQPERSLEIGRPARDGRPGPAHYKPGRPAQPARRTDARRPRPATRRTGHTPRGGPRTAARPPSKPPTSSASLGSGRRPCPALSQAPSGPHSPLAHTAGTTDLFRCCEPRFHGARERWGLDLNRGPRWIEPWLRAPTLPQTHSDIFAAAVEGPTSPVATGLGPYGRCRARTCDLLRVRQAL